MSLTPNSTAALARTSGIANGFVLAVMIFFEVIGSLVRGSFTWLGIRAWDFAGLWALFTAPFVHRDYSHLAANAVPLLVLGFIIALGGLRQWAYVTLAGAIGSGLFAFIMNRPGTITIGASGIVFAYLTYLVTRGLFSRNTRQIVLGMIVLVVYGSLLWGIFPSQIGISWQGHLGGAVSGVLIASLLNRGARAK